MRWKIASAKQRFSELVSRAAREPQVISRRDKPVVAVIRADELRPFLEWRAARRRPSMLELLAEARRICDEEGIDGIEVPPRSDRLNPLLSEERRAPRRHKRRQ